MHRDTNGARLIGNRASDGLANPPGSIGRKFVAAAPFKFIHGFHQADVALLDQIQELQTAIRIFLGNGHDQAQVRFDQFLLGLLGFRFAAMNDREGALQFREPDFAGLFDIFQLGAARAQLFARFRGHIALGDVHAAFQPARFAFQRLQALHRAAHLVDQALFFKGVEVDITNGERNLHACAGHVPFRMDVRALLGFRRLLQLDRLLQRVVIQLGDFLDVLERLLGLVRDLFFGELFIVELHDLFDGPHALAQIVPNRDQFLDDDWRARNGLHDHELPALYALGDGDFTFARKQRHRAHFAQVHAHRIVGFLQRARRQVQIALRLVRVFLHHHFAIAAFAGHLDRARGLGRSLIFVNLDAVALKCCEKVVDFFRGMHFRRKRIVHFVIQQVAALFADRN